MPKYIFVTGGVVSSLGKGIATASISLLLKKRNLKVTTIKLDPYLNVDPGTMNPFQHGEVFVTADGAETDLDLGHYERFIDEELSALNNVTSGQVYHTVIEKERRGDYLGGTVQVVPHLTDEIKSRIKVLARKGYDIIISEIGGTVGDIESLPFLEAIRQMRLEEGEENTLFLHLTLVPFIKTAGELKTKPTQHGVQKLREIGIQPDIILCRTDGHLTKKARSKIALFTNVPENSVLEAADVEYIYEIPLIFHKGELDDIILNKLHISAPLPDLSDWEDLVNRLKHPKGEVKVALCGKYVHLRDSYKSILEALAHAGASNSVKVTVLFVDSEEIERKGTEILREAQGILVAPGFGPRGTEGKIEAVRYAREKRLPFLGICFGMQLATVEIARNVLGLKKANSTELDPRTPDPVITIIPEKKGIKYFGGTLRRGNYKAKIKKGTLTYKIYSQEIIEERHRHRYEFNPDYIERFESCGLVTSGITPVGNLVEIVELKDHPFFIGVQFHPEFRSRPMRPHPLFYWFIKKVKETGYEKI